MKCHGKVTGLKPFFMTCSSFGCSRIISSYDEIMYGLSLLLVYKFDVVISVMLGEYWSIEIIFTHRSL